MITKGISFRISISHLFFGKKEIGIVLLSFLQFFALFLFQGWCEPELNIPPPPPDALKGGKIIEILTPLGLEEREAEIYKLFARGNVPVFYRKLCGITVSAEIKGVKRNATYFVIPDYLALGRDDDYFLTPMTPGLTQKVANLAGCCLPTRKMVNDIYAQARVKLVPAPIPPSDQMTTVKVFERHNNMVWDQRKDLLTSEPLGALVGGDKKDVVITPQIHTCKPPARVAIFGWHKLDGKPIQPLSLVHGASYADYSHGIRLVSLSMIVDGVSRTVPEVLADPDLSVLLSDEGAISNPRYPVSKSPDILPVQASSDLVRNGSFEEGFKIGTGQFWQKWEGKDSNPVITGEAQKNVHDGKSAQYWARPDTLVFDGGFYQVVSVNPDDLYEITAWLKRQSDFQGASMAFGYDLSGGTDGSAASVNYTDLSASVNNTWVRYNVIVKAVGTSLTLFARGGHNDPSGGDKAYFYLDHVSLFPVAAPLTPTPDLSFLD